MQRDDAYLLDILIAARKALKNAHVRARHSTQIPPLAHISASYQMHPAMQDALGNALPLHLTWRQQ